MSDETEIRFNRERHAERVEMWKQQFKPEAPLPPRTVTEWELPKFWIGEKTIPERVVRKVDPGIFLREYVHPILTELAQAIATARITGKAFKIVSFVRFLQEDITFENRKAPEEKVSQDQSAASGDAGQPGQNG